MTLLGGRYTLDVPLGDSDLGTVWNAHDDTGTPLVVVTLEADAPAPLQDRFRAHAKALVKTPHPNLVRGIAEGEESGAPYLVLERLTGESLATRLEAGPALTVARVVEIATSLAEALVAVHAAGIAHGDVEPGNVLLVTDGGKEVPKLIGFGLNRASLRQELGARMSLPSLGPVAYAAPEQARGDVLDGALADQASLAAIVYAALGGRPPHIARDIAALATAIGSDKPTLLSLVRRDLAPFASTLDRALSSDPKKRFPDMAHFGRALKTAGSLARAIATTTVPLGARSPIGEPPAPALPRSAAIPRPAGALGARVPGPGKAAIPKPSATSTPHPAPAAPAAADASRTTQELATGDLTPLAAEAQKPAATSTPQPPPKAPPKEPEPEGSTRATEELDVSELQSIPPPAASDEAPRVSLPELASAELDSLPPEPPVATAPPPPPPPAPPHAPSKTEAETAAPNADGGAAALVEASAAGSTAATQAKPDEAAEPAVAFSPSMEKIVAAAAEQRAIAPTPDDDDVPSLESVGGGRPWLVPAAIGAVAILAIVSWFGYRATQSDPQPEVAGRTLTVTPPPTTATVPATTIAAPPPDTTVPDTTVPVTTVPATTVPPPETEVESPPPPATRVTPPATRVSPPTTHAPRPPATRTPTRPPTTTTARTPTHPPAHPPPTTTTRRPTVVSDPGF